MENDKINPYDNGQGFFARCPKCHGFKNDIRPWCICNKKTADEEYEEWLKETVVRISGYQTQEIREASALEPAVTEILKGE
jgi:hypothetical protein